MVVALKMLGWTPGWRGEERAEGLLPPKGYAAARKQDGWMKSAVFGQSFRLSQEKDALGHPLFTLEVR